MFNTAIFKKYPKTVFLLIAVLEQVLEWKTAKYVLKELLNFEEKLSSMFVIG